MGTPPTLAHAAETHLCQQHGVVLESTSYLLLCGVHVHKDLPKLCGWEGGENSARESPQTPGSPLSHHATVPSIPLPCPSRCSGVHSTQ